MSKSLTSIPTLVESPFIIATIGGVTFGSYTSTGSTQNFGSSVSVTYPNYMKSVNIQKVNGTVNTYTLNFTYQVRIGDDPNMLDKIFSRATKDRKITLSYGDWNAPNHIYKEETGIITNVTSSLNMNNSCIDYTIQCVSDAIGLNATTYSFAARKAKPSDVLKSLVTNNKYGLKKVFTGMQDINKVLSNNLIDSNDKEVDLLPQRNVTVLAYMNYLVGCMINNNSTRNGDLSNSKYYLTIHDDYTNQLGGTYFKVNEVSNNTKTISATDTYEIDVNYPGDNFVTQFALNNDQSWSILYEFSEDLNQEKYVYNIDDEGHITTKYVPSILKSTRTQDVSAAKTQWWTNMTRFPVQATLTIKGLTRPSILMTYVKLNVWFAGGIKHISSGMYIIIKQVDQIDSNGYKTTLTLLRVGGDE